MLSRTTPRLLTWGEGDTEEFSMVLDEVGLVPLKRTLVLLFNLRKVKLNQMFYFRDTISEGGGQECG